MFGQQYSDARNKRWSTVQRDTIQKLLALTQESKSPSALNSQNSATPRLRLLNLSEEIASIVNYLARDFCNCRFSTEVSVGKIEDFEAEMKIQCPIHGPCRLGTIIVVSVHGFHPNKSRLEQLIKEYDRRCQLWKDGGRQ